MIWNIFLNNNLQYKALSYGEFFFIIHSKRSMQFQSRFESTSMLPPMEPNWIVLNNFKVYSVEPIDLLQIICSLCGMYLVCVCVFECKLSLFQWKSISVDLTMYIRRKCGKILLRFYYENGFGLAELGLIWLGLTAV